MTFTSLTPAILNNAMALTAREITAKISNTTLERCWEAVSEADLAKSTVATRKQLARLESEMRARDLLDA